LGREKFFIGFSPTASYNDNLCGVFLGTLPTPNSTWPNNTWITSVPYFTTFNWGDPLVVPAKITDKAGGAVNSPKMIWYILV
jgi:hypothetical protein